MDRETTSRPRAVVAGGSGLIGRRLVAALLTEGWSVDVLTRGGRAARRIPSGARAVTWAATPDLELAAALDGATGVVNLAGTSIGSWPWTPGRKRALVSSRLGATNALVAAMGELPPERRPRVLVNASGTDLYTGRDETPADERTAPASDFLAELCVRWEAAARAAEALDIRVVMLRTAFVLAPDAPALRLLTLPFRLFVGGRVGSGRQWFSWIHVDDVVRLYVRALADETLVGPVNATAPEPVAERDLAAALGRTLHRPNWFPTPAWPLRLVLQGQSTLILGSRRVVPVRASAAGFVFRHPDLGEALADVL